MFSIHFPADLSSLRCSLSQSRERCSALEKEASDRRDQMERLQQDKNHQIHKLK